MKRTHWLVIGVLALLLAVGAAAWYAGTAWGQSDIHAPSKGTDVQGEKVMELADILHIAEQHLTGQIVKVELERDDDGFTYEVKVLTENGRVREITLDAHDGSLIGIEDD